MKAAMARGVDLMIFNSLHELNKIQKSAPKARLILSSESSGKNFFLKKNVDLAF